MRDVLPMSKRTLLIDGDILAYTAAVISEEVIAWGDDEDTVIADFGKAQREVEKMIDRWKLATCSDDHVICLSSPDHHYFRHDIYPTYKAHRTSGRKPKLRHDVEKFLRDLGGVSYPNLEADDVMGIMATAPGQDTHYVIATNDKDLDQIPGLHLNMRKGEVSYVAALDAEKFFYQQALTGDPVDGFPGCPRVGPVRAKELIAEHVTETCMGGESCAVVLDGVSLWAAIVNLYAHRGLDEQHALTQARVARILQFQDYDQETKEVRLWTPMT